MKTAQDISPSAVLCLALGLLIGNMLMPERQKLDYAAAWLPTQDATPVDLSEGRLLERLPDNSGSSTGEITHAYTQDLQTEAAQGNATAVQELTLLLQRLRAAEKPALMSDASALMMIAFFISLGMATAYTDMIELSEEEVASDVVAKEEVVSNANWLRSLKYLILCICVVGVSAIVLPLCSSCFNGSAASDSDEHVSTQELSNLDNGSTKQRPALAPDSFVVLVLGAFGVLALFVMKTDIREMAEELRRGPSGEVEEKQPSHPSIPRVSGLLAVVSRLFAVVALLAALTSIAMAIWPDGRTAPTNFVEQASITELKGIALLVDGSFNMLLDFVLELFLGVCTVLGLAVMRVDICDMVKQLQDESSSTSRLEAKMKAG